MPKVYSHFVRFKRLHLQNYGVFFGLNDFVFDQQRTIIVGAGGSGKTTIVNALVHNGPAPGVKPNIHADSSKMSVSVSINGNPNLVERYSSIIFLNCRFDLSLIYVQKAIFAEVLDYHQRKIIRDEAGDIFHKLVERRSGKVNVHEDLNPKSLSAAENICSGYGFAFAVRKVLNLDLPAVFDLPYMMLSAELRHRVSEFLKVQSCQQILLGLEGEFSEENQLNYRLDSSFHN